MSPRPAAALTGKEDRQPATLPQRETESQQRKREPSASFCGWVGRQLFHHVGNLFAIRGIGMVFQKLAKESERLRRLVLGERQLGAKDLPSLPVERVARRREKALDRRARCGCLTQVELDCGQELASVIADRGRCVRRGDGSFESRQGGGRVAPLIELDPGVVGFARAQLSDLLRRDSTGELPIAVEVLVNVGIEV